MKKKEIKENKEASLTVPFSPVQPISVYFLFLLFSYWATLPWPI
jgi:hypothetical protein